MKDYREIWANQFARNIEIRNVIWAIDVDFEYELAAQPWQDADNVRTLEAIEAATKQNEYIVRQDRADMVLAIALYDRRVHISTKARDIDGNRVIYISRRADGAPVARFHILAIEEFIEKRMYRHNILGYPPFDD